MKHLFKISCAAILSCAAFISSSNAAAVAAKIELSASRTPSNPGLESFLEQNVKPEAQFFLEVLKQKEKSDDDFAEWFNGLSEDEQVLLQCLVKWGIVDEIDAIKKGATRVSTKRQIIRAISLLVGGFAGAGLATGGFEENFKLFGLDGLFTIMGACTGWTAEELGHWIYANSAWLWKQEEAFSDRFQNIVEKVESKLS